MSLVGCRSQERHAISSLGAEFAFVKVVFVRHYRISELERRHVSLTVSCEMAFRS